MNDTEIKIPLESLTWFNYLSDLISCPKKPFDIEGIPIQLHTPPESPTSKPQTITPKPDPDTPKLTWGPTHENTPQAHSPDPAKSQPLTPKTPKTPKTAKIQYDSLQNSKLKRRDSYSEVIDAQNAIHIGIDVGGTLIKVAIICKETYALEMNLDREIRKDVRIGSFLMMYYKFKTVDIEDLASRFENKILPHYTKDYIWVTGGGALKWRSWFEAKFKNIKIRTEEEMASIYDGMQLTLDLNANIVYKLDKTLENKLFFDSDKFDYPLLIVNIGSGVSFISMTESSYKRVGGTPLGGSTFLGLCRKLIGIDDFDTLIELTEAGNESNVD